MDQNIRIRPIKLDDMAEMNKLFAPRGMNDGEHIFRLVFQTCDNTRWMVALNERDEIIGAERGIKLDFPDVSVIDCCRLAIHPDYRNRGLVERLRVSWGPTPSTGNAFRESVLMMTSLKKFTTKLASYHGRPTKEGLNAIFPRNEATLDFNVAPLEDNDFEHLLEYDRTIFDYDRRKFMREYCRESKDGEHYSKTVVAKSISNGNILGFGNLREYEGIWKFLPLYAESTIVAEELLKALTRFYVDQCPKEPLRLVFNATNRTMYEYCKMAGLKHEYTTIRAYMGGDPDPALMENYVKKGSVYVYQTYWPA